MNVAFPALLVVLLLLPGIIFRYAYARGWWGSKSPTSRAVSDELAYGVVFAAALHTLWLTAVTLAGYPADYQALLALLLGNFGKDSGEYADAVRAVSAHPGKIALYFLTLWAGAGLLGGGLHTLVRTRGWDREYQILRFRNEWWYLLSGECLEFPENPFNADAPVGGEGGHVLVYLSAVVDHGKGSFLYRGIVTDWNLDKDGRLDTVELALAHRRALTDDRKPDEAAVAPNLAGAPDARYYDIDGERFILRYAEMRTINLSYASLTEEQPSDEPTETGEVTSPSPGGVSQAYAQVAGRALRLVNSTSGGGAPAGRDPSTVESSPTDQPLTKGGEAAP